MVRFFKNRDEIPKGYFYAPVPGGFVASEKAEEVAPVYASPPKREGFYLYRFSDGSHLLLDLYSKAVLKGDKESLLRAFPYAEEVEVPERLPVPPKSDSFYNLYRKQILLGTVILAALGALFVLFTGKREKPPTVVPPRSAEVLKPVKEQKVCTSNAEKVLTNWVWGAFVFPKGKTLYEALKTKGGLIEVPVNPEPFASPWDGSLTLTEGIKRITLKGNPNVFVGDDYDLCLNFLEKNQRTPLVVLYLSRNKTAEGYNCIVVLPPECLKEVKR